MNIFAQQNLDYIRSVCYSVFAGGFYRRCDVIVEVCHPQIVRDFGLKFLSEAHFMVRLFSLINKIQT